MISELANHLWQSTLFAVAVGLLTLMCRKNHASVRYWLWFSASVKFLIPFTLLMELGDRLPWASKAPHNRHACRISDARPGEPPVYGGPGTRSSFYSGGTSRFRLACLHSSLPHGFPESSRWPSSVSGCGGVSEPPSARARRGPFTACTCLRAWTCDRLRA